MEKNTKLYISGICAFLFLSIALFAVNPFNGPDFKILKETSEPIIYHYERISPNWDIEYDYRIKEIVIEGYGLYEEGLGKYVCYQELEYLENESDKVYITGAGFNDYDGLSVGSCSYYLAHIEEGIMNISYEGYLDDVSYNHSNYIDNYSQDNIEFINNTIYNHNKFHGVDITVTFYESETKEEEVDVIELELLVGENLTSSECRDLGRYSAEPNGDCYDYKIISKEILNIDWLNENCDCGIALEFCVNDGCEKDNSPCDEYVCGKYTVEVKND